MARTGPERLANGEGWALYDQAIRTLIPRERADLGPIYADPAVQFVDATIEFARQLSFRLIAAHETIRDLKRENATLHYLLGDRIA